MSHNMVARGPSIVMRLGIVAFSFLSVEDQASSLYLCRMMTASCVFLVHYNFIQEQVHSLCGEICLSRGNVQYRLDYTFAHP